ncbi:hypothetical protein D3C81_1702270 [compost metagenome]
MTTYDQNRPGQGPNPGEPERRPGQGESPERGNPDRQSPGGPDDPNWLPGQEPQPGQVPPVVKEQRKFKPDVPTNPTQKPDNGREDALDPPPDYERRIEE